MDITIEKSSINGRIQQKMERAGGSQNRPASTCVFKQTAVGEQAIAGYEWPLLIKK